MKATCPNNPTHNQFITTAHVVEEWLVDSEGNWNGTLGCLEVAADPDPDNIWTCNECQAEATVEW